MRTVETPADMIQLQLDCVKLTHQIVERCNKVFSLKLPQFQVQFSLHGTTAGKAFIGRRLIQYNPTLLRENPDAFLSRTVGHEVVHHAAFAKYGMSIKPHGEEWKNMMWKLGFPNSTCHSYDTSNVPSQRGKSCNSLSGKVLGLNGEIIRAIQCGKITEFD